MKICAILQSFLSKTVSTPQSVPDVLKNAMIWCRSGNFEFVDLAPLIKALEFPLEEQQDVSEFLEKLFTEGLHGKNHND